MILTRGLGVGTGNLKVAFDAFALWKGTTPHSPIALQLPVELLQKIFFFLAELHPSSSDRRHYLPPCPHWIPITHVCRYWRSAALGLHEIWSFITPGLSISWAQAMMERSAPLSVHVNIRVTTMSTDGLHPLAASELLFAASRISTLRILGLRADVLRVLDRLRSPSPLLESLDLSIVDSGLVVDLPETLFGGKAPHLRRLTFAADTCIRTPRWLLNGITDFTTGADISLSELIEALRAMPQLEFLRVQHCRAVWDEEDTTGGPTHAPPPPRVTLPNLSLISFRDTTPRRFVMLSSRIDAPKTVRRHIFWRSWAVSNWDRWSSFLDTIRRLLLPHDSFTSVNDGDLRVAHVAGGPARGSFSMWTRSAMGPATPGSRSEALFLFCIDWIGSPVDPRGEASLLDHASPLFHLAGLCSELRATYVQDLTIEPDTEQAQVVDWEPLIGALSSVQILRLHGGTSSASLLRSISTHSHLLPNLQKLYVVQCAVRYTAPRPDGIILWNVKLKKLALGGSSGTAGRSRDVVDVGEELVAVVRSRYGIEVVLIGCDVDAGALEVLRKRAQVGIGDEWVYV
ncbi:hypothetical protein B0F90DRAFT_1818232 [Multifurca ochricompacta]|uniref:F-box domain-containing protein n=1 Tax=Multifurca ochricompacta TaxID=376703 RepID=A0AAD4M279_9AGAM|nr:hypothetical protein B0F90DRAFT_1818232 [Multifurca ochricompacta]